jgi:hypothetical protein
VADTALSSGHLPRALLLGIEGAGLATVLLAMVAARAAWVVAGVGTVALAEGTVLALGGPAVLAPILGMLLLAGAELALWSVERARPAQESAAVAGFRAVRLLALALVGGGVAVLVLAVADLPVTGGFDLTALGVLATIAILATLLWLGRDALGASLRRHAS